MADTLEVRSMYDQRASFYNHLLKLVRYESGIISIIKEAPLELPKNPKILDLGCGTGIATKAILERFPDAELIGLDNSAEMLRKYNENYPDIPTINQDFNEKISRTLKPNSLDLVVSAGAISEYCDPKKAIPNVYTLLKENSTFLNIGVKNNPLGYISKKLWSYRQIGKSKFAKACHDAGFKHIIEIPIPIFSPDFFKFFPANLYKYIIKAIK